MRARSSGSSIFGSLRIDVDRQRALAQQPIGRVLVGGDDVVGLDAETHGDFAGERLRVRVGRRRARAGAGDQQGSCQIGLPSLRQ